jgi:radical SAM-linked protein
MQLAAALPLGFTSECELADIWLLESVDPLTAGPVMAAKMAPGIELQSVVEVDLRESALQNQVVEAEYLARPNESPGQEQMNARVTQFMAASNIVRERRGKEYDLRPLVFDLRLADRQASVGQEGDLLLMMRLSMMPGKTGRPDEVLLALAIDPLNAHIHRKRLILANEEN